MLTAKLRGSTEIFVICQPWHMHSLAYINIPHWSGTFVTIDEPTSAHHDHPEVHSMQSLQFIFGIVHSVALDKCLMTCIHLYNVIQSIFTPVEILSSTYSSISSPSPNLWQPLTDLFYCCHSFTFSKMSYNWNHIVCNLLWLASFT